MESLPVPESCTQCPHVDEFHSTCSHPFRQSIVQTLAKERDTCPVFAEVRADAMQTLEERIC
ncbi:hypothetical protein RBH26_05930 [Natronolimnohabitans sp. A-GB9]|uniref:hypothetical protein n=1 Tax=Natronolimnohabitans sp. A-GB9 TaxID=3069757 RepID=UPI0027B3CF7B|nr:hypothetical protein [Natronolimnohabitans sp. A-GB9]MDQ2050018.1 hypothetical protein [Natronolimnohabitans sp. A-GB9]